MLKKCCIQHHNYCSVSVENGVHLQHEVLQMTYAFAVCGDADILRHALVNTWHWPGELTLNDEQLEFFSERLKHHFSCHLGWQRKVNVIKEWGDPQHAGDLWCLFTDVHKHSLHFGRYVLEKHATEVFGGRAFPRALDDLIVRVFSDLRTAREAVPGSVFDQVQGYHEYPHYVEDEDEDEEEKHDGPPSPPRYTNDPMTWAFQASFRFCERKFIVTPREVVAEDDVDEEGNLCEEVLRRTFFDV